MVSCKGFDICKPLVDAGLIPKDTRRIVIDIKATEIVTVYYETNASKEMLDVSIESLVRFKDGIESIEVR